MKRLAPVLLVVLAVLLAGCFGPPQTGLGTLVVESNPPGATVLLNGEDTGHRTPATLEKVRAGTHTVTVRLDGLEPQTERVSVRRGQTTVVQFFFETEVPPAQPDQAVVTGMVSENLGGRNVPGATVTAYEAGTDTAVKNTITDAQGRYVLTLPAGTYDIVVDKPGHAQGKRQSLTVDEGDVVTANLIAKEFRDPSAGEPLAPTIHVFIEDEGGGRVPFEAGMFVPFADLTVGVVEVDAAFDMYRIQVRIGHRDYAADYQAGILRPSLVFGLGDLLPGYDLTFDAPGDTSLIVTAYDYHNNWTELVIPFAYEVAQPGPGVEPVELGEVRGLEVHAVTYGTDLGLYQREREWLYASFGLPGDPSIQDLGDGLYVDLSRLDKDVTMYVALWWNPVYYEQDDETYEAPGYEIQRSFAAPGRWESIAKVGNLFGQPYLDMSPELRPGQRVYYRVRAIGPHGEPGPWSEPVYTIPLDRLEVNLVSPAHNATNVPLQPTLKWTHTDVGADVYVFHGFVAGVTGVPDGEFGFYAWYFEDLVNQTEVLYNFDGTGVPLRPATVYQWNVVDVMASAVYGPRSSAVAFAGSGLAEENGYGGAANGEFIFMTTADAE